MTKKMWTREMKVNIGVSVASFILLFVFLEIFFMVFYPVPMYGLDKEGLFAYSNETDFGLSPNYTGRIITKDFSVNTSINGLGLNDYDDLTYESNKKTVLFIGDSMTEGYGVEKEESIPKVFEKSINSSRYRVVNGGIRGYSTVQENKFLNYEGRKYHPDYIVLIFVDNDLENNLQNVILYRDMLTFSSNNLTFMDKLKIDIFLMLRKSSTFRFLYYEIYFNKKQNNFKSINEWAMGVSRNQTLLDAFENRIFETKRLSEGMNATLIVVLEPWLKSYQNDGNYTNSQGVLGINNEVSGILLKENISYIDLTSDIMDIQKKKEIYFKYQDGHFNKEGAYFIGRKLAEKIVLQ